MTLHASSTTNTTENPTESSMSIRQQPDLVQRYAFELGPCFRSSDKLDSALIVFAHQFFQLNRAALAYLLFGCNLAVLDALHTTKSLAAMSVTALSKLAWSAWDSKRSRQLRKKLEFEFFVLILGSGNGFILMLFWPGWILIGLVYALYLLCS